MIKFYVYGKGIPKMNRQSLASKIKQIIVIVSLLLLFAPFAESYAKTGCCSRHGGVAGCNTASGNLQCKDGTVSPSCACEGTNTSVIKPVKVNTKATKAVTTPATTNVKQTTSTATPQAVAPAAPATKVKTAGCCARHGGIAQCNKSTGYFMCKDGTQSGTCQCS